jgi:hypothetical protein
LKVALRVSSAKSGSTLFAAGVRRVEDQLRGPGEISW